MPPKAETSHLVAAPQEKNTMTETVFAELAVARRRSGRPATVSASVLAQHLDCSRSVSRSITSSAT